jgi:hypothetical protein
MVRDIELAEAIACIQLTSFAIGLRFETANQSLAMFRGKRPGKDHNVIGE